MRWFGIFVAGAVIVLGCGLWVYSGLEDARDSAWNFCLTLRGGELWAPALDRARSRELTFAKVSRSGEAIETFQAERDAFGRRFACTVEVDRGHVLRTRTSELPQQ